MKFQNILKSVTSILVLILVSHVGMAQIRGNGNVIEMERDIPSFSGISVSSGIDLFIRQGSNSSLEIKADENLQEYIIAEVKGDVLHIYVKKNTRIWRSNAMDAYVTVAGLGSIRMSGGGDVESQSPISTDRLTIAISGGGDLEMELDAGTVEASISGGGDVELNGAIKEYLLELSGGGDLELGASLEKFHISISGGGDAHIRGGSQVSVASIQMSGGGDLDMDVECNSLKTSISGGGDAEIKAGRQVDEAQVSVSGGGDLELGLNAGELKLMMGGGGDATLAGTTGSFSAEIKSGGDLHASEFKAEKAMLRLTGGSDARVYVTDQLNVEASGGGHIYVTGDPQINASLSGGSKVHKK